MKINWKKHNIRPSW